MTVEEARDAVVFAAYQFGSVNRASEAHAMLEARLGTFEAVIRAPLEARIAELDELRFREGWEDLAQRLEKDRDDWKRRAEAAEKVVEALRGCNHIHANITTALAEYDALVGKE